MFPARSVTSLLRATALSLTVLSMAAPWPAVAQDAAPPVPDAQPAAPDAAPAAPAAPATPQGLSESVAATVNDEIISTYDLVQRMRLLIVTTGVQPTAETMPSLQAEALRSLIDEHLQIQELHRVEKSQKIDLVASDDEVNEELADIAKGNNISLDQLVGSLAQRGVNPDTFRNQVRTNISWQRWISGRYGSRLRIGDDQIKAVQQRLAEAASKPQYQISEVFIDASRVGGMDAAQSGAAQLSTQLQQGAPFAAVARQFSSDTTAANGGDAGWVAVGELPPEVGQALESMRPGQLSKPILVKEGVYIVLLRDKRSGSSATLVSLKQAAIPLGGDATPAQVGTAQATLEALRPKLTGCDNLEAIAGKVNGVVASDLGEAEVKDLAPAFRTVAESLQPGQVSDPIRTAIGLHLVAVCGKRQEGGQIPSHDQIESRLFNQQLSQISKRYLRDLKNSATIEFK